VEHIWNTCWIPAVLPKDGLAVTDIRFEPVTPADWHQFEGLFGLLAGVPE
jgi:hypothetical protein